MVNNPDNEFIFGPPEGMNKPIGAHRNRIIHKLEPRMQLYARKLRQMYFREGTIPTAKTFIDPARLRQGDDTIEALTLNNQFVPGVIKAREDFPDIDAVWPWKVPF